MKVVYVAGPFRAKAGGDGYWEQEQNIRRAEELALRVWRAGAACICPHTNTRYYQGSAPDEVWLEGDLAILSRCDAVLMTPDWQRSTGATEEHRFAREKGMEVFYAFEEMLKWISAESGDGTNGANAT